MLGRLARAIIRLIGRTRGTSLAEISVSLLVISTAGTGFIGAVAVGAKVSVAPTQTTASQTVVSQVRNVNLNIPDDSRSAQSVLSGDDPVWAVSSWIDYTGLSAEYHTITYAWNDANDSMVRSTVVDGASMGSAVIARFLDQFADASIGFNSSLPPFLLETSISPEVDTPTGSEKRDFTMVSFLRGPIPPPVPVGGYALFSTDKIRLAGTNNTIIGDVHANTDILVSCLKGHIAGFAGAVEGIILRPGSCFYMHNDPTPPSGDTLSPGITVDLVLGNASSRGIAVGPNATTDRPADSQAPSIW